MYLYTWKSNISKHLNKRKLSQQPLSWRTWAILLSLFVNHKSWAYIRNSQFVHFINCNYRYIILKSANLRNTPKNSNQNETTLLNWSDGKQDVCFKKPYSVIECNLLKYDIEWCKFKIIARIYIVYSIYTRQFHVLLDPMIIK